MNKVKHYRILVIFIMITSLYIQPSQAEEQPANDNTYLHVARDQLSLAFEKYNKGDISAAKNNLRKASDWLNKAITHSKYDTIKNEATKLTSEIDSLRLTLNHSTEQNDISRFWHQATSLIIRESEQLIHSYVKSSNDNITLKHLLDAKMHFFLAEHDLFVSYDMEYAIEELNDSLEYLNQAVSVAEPELKTRINNLINKIKEVASLTEVSKDAWKKDKLLGSLDKAINNIKSATSNATPPTRLRLNSINQDIQKLKQDILTTNLKTRYDSIMADFTRAIHTESSD